MERKMKRENSKKENLSDTGKEKTQKEPELPRDKGTYRRERNEMKRKKTVKAKRSILEAREIGKEW